VNIDEQYKTRLRELVDQHKSKDIGTVCIYPALRIGPAGIKYRPPFGYDKPGEPLTIYEDILDRIPRSTLTIIKTAWKAWGPGMLVIMAERKGGMKEIARIAPRDHIEDKDGNV